MSSPDSNQMQQTSAHTTGTITESRLEPIRLVSPCTEVFETVRERGDAGTTNASNKSQLTIQQDITTILRQLETDLLEAVRMVSAPRCHTVSYTTRAEHDIESVIKECVNNALTRWAPDIATSLSPAAEESLAIAADLSDWSLCCLTEGTPNLLSPSFEIPITSSEAPATSAEVLSASESIDQESHTDHDPPFWPGEPLDSGDRTSSESRDIHYKTASTAENVEFTDRHRGRAKRDAWEQHRPVLRRLYVDENQPLPDVMRTMRENYNFGPTVKQYRYQLGSKWGWKKYNQGTAKGPSRQPDQDGAAKTTTPLHSRETWEHHFTDCLASDIRVVSFNCKELTGAHSS
ncbi:Clr5 domain-containing protein [Xylaria sp. FL0933]|nr:Clr5 domain-containing protein [Xylaria sp. FL0933]